MLPRRGLFLLVLRFAPTVESLCLFGLAQWTPKGSVLLSWDQLPSHDQPHKISAARARRSAVTCLRCQLRKSYRCRPFVLASQCPMPRARISQASAADNRRRARRPSRSRLASLTFNAARFRHSVELYMPDHGTPPHPRLFEIDHNRGQPLAIISIEHRHN